VEARDDGTPGALPAQALDHGTGFLLAAAVLRALAERERTGGVWRAELSLAQTAAWLLRAGVDDAGLAVEPPADWSPWLRETDCYAGPLRYAAPPFTLPDGPVDWATAPVALGSSPAAWR
jgi:crotonobetainyl-CoA:carnitine CoA-transferase CaiB-like acyl-CoA transferase